MNTRKTILSSLAILALTACAGGGMYDKPYALFEPEARSVPAETRPAFVLSIDGASRSIGSNDPVTPGVRRVEVSIPGPTGMSNPQRDTLTIDAKPCTRYLLAAKRPSLDSRDWSAFVAGTEPIGECQKKFAAPK